MKEQQCKLNEKLRGHDAYYGVTSSSHCSLQHAMKPQPHLGWRVVHDQDVRGQLLFGGRHDLQSTPPMGIRRRKNC